MFTRKIKYNPTQEERQTNLTYKYSLDNNKVIKEYRSWFIRVCDYPYSELNGKKIIEHYLLIPKDQKIIIGKSMLDIEEERANQGYYINRNPQHKQSIKGIYHKHILKVEDGQQDINWNLLIN